MWGSAQHCAQPRRAITRGNGPPRGSRPRTKQCAAQSRSHSNSAAVDSKNIKKVNGHNIHFLTSSFNVSLISFKEAPVNFSRLQLMSLMPLTISPCDSSTARVKTRPFPLAAEGGQWAVETPDTPGWESSSNKCAPLGPWLSVNKYIYKLQSH